MPPTHACAPGAEPRVRHWLTAVVVDTCNSSTDLKMPEDYCVFSPGLGYIVKTMPARATRQDPVSKTLTPPKRQQ